MKKVDVKKRIMILSCLGFASFFLFLMIQLLDSDNDLAKIYFLCFSILCFFIITLYNISSYLRKNDYTE
jgi:hypothetical protein